MTRRRASALSFMLITLLLGLVTFVYHNANLRSLLPAPLAVQPGFYRVLEVHDGDTITVDMHGTPEKVRMIGIDTPETHKPNTPVQCFGPQASSYAKQLLQNKTVRLEADPTNDNRDRYNRLLRYVYTEDGTLVEETLIASGYGFAYTSFPFQKSATFVDLQNQAQQNNAGLWAACTTRETNGRWQTEYIN